MYPTRVPTYSTEIGTSRSTTDSTFTTAAGGDEVARDASPHPAAVITTSPVHESTRSARLPITRLLLSAGVGGKRIHALTATPRIRHSENPTAGHPGRRTTARSLYGA